MSARAGHTPQSGASIRSAWAACAPATGGDFPSSPLARGVALAMAPPWTEAIAVLQALAAARGLPLEPDPRILALGKSKPQRLKQHYPLFAELMRIGAEGARAEILIGLFGDFNGTETGIYYDQFLAVRRCLDALEPALPDPGGDWRQRAWAAKRALALSLAQASITRGERYQDLEDFTALLEATRQVGERRRAQNTRRAGARDRDERLGERALHDAAFAQRIARRQTTPSARGGATPGAKRRERALMSPGAAPPTIKSAGMSARVSECRDDANDALSIECVGENTLSPTDTRRAAQRIANHLPGSAIPSPADRAVLPLAAIRNALEVLVDNALDFILAWLVLATSMPAERLVLLRQRTAAPVDECPHFDGTHLLYRLKNGPTADTGERGNQIVRIALPERIAQQLRAWGGQLPLAGRRDRVDNRLAHALGNTPGMTPTLNRLRISAAKRIADRAEGRTKAQMLAGGFNLGHVAPATYRTVSAAALQGLFADHLHTLARALIDISPAEGNGLRPWLVDLSAPPDLGGPPTGSARALPLSAYPPMFKALEAAGADAHRIALQHPRGSSKEAQAIAEQCRLEAAATTLAFLLGTGARPIGERIAASRAPAGTQSVQHPMLYLRDKDSHAYGEARVIPLASALAKALDQLEQRIATAARHLRAAGWHLEDSRPPYRRALPAWIRLRPGREAVIAVFTHADLLDALAAHGILDPRVSPNSTRHTVCNALERTLDPSAVNAVMGHVGAGGSHFHPEALTTPDLGAIKRALADGLRRAGFRSP